jgi:hypothetical protein
LIDIILTYTIPFLDISAGEEQSFEEIFYLLDTNSSIGEVTYIACMVVA